MSEESEMVERFQETSKFKIANKLEKHQNEEKKTQLWNNKNVEKLC